MRLELDDCVRWAGALPNAEVAEWYRAADVFVLPTRSEGTPNVVLECMASGTPVVASRVGGIPEVIQDQHNGLLFESEDVEELSRCIDRLVRDPELARRLSRQALDDVQEHSVERQIQKNIDVYRRVVVGAHSLS